VKEKEKKNVVVEKMEPALWLAASNSEHLAHSERWAMQLGISIAFCRCLINNIVWCRGAVLMSHITIRLLGCWLI